MAPFAVDKKGGPGLSSLVAITRAAEHCQLDALWARCVQLLAQSLLSEQQPGCSPWGQQGVRAAAPEPGFGAFGFGAPAVPAAAAPAAPAVPASRFTFGAPAAATCAPVEDVLKLQVTLTCLLQVQCSALQCRCSHSGVVVMWGGAAAAQIGFKAEPAPSCTPFADHPHSQCLILHFRAVGLPCLPRHGCVCYVYSAMSCSGDTYSTLTVPAGPQQQGTAGGYRCPGVQRAPKQGLLLNT